MAVPKVQAVGAARTFTVHGGFRVRVLPDDLSLEQFKALSFAEQNEYAEFVEFEDGATVTEAELPHNVDGGAIDDLLASGHLELVEPEVT